MTAPAGSSSHELEIQGGVQRRGTLFGEYAFALIEQALADLSHSADVEEEDVATARHFLLSPESVLPHYCELLSLDYELLRRAALSRSTRREAVRATLAAHNRALGRDRTRRAA